MISGGGSHSSQSSNQSPGTASPVTALFQELFGGKVRQAGGQFQPTAWGGPDSLFQPEMFAALPGLLQNRPATDVEKFITSSGFQGLGLANAFQGQDILNQGAATLPALLQTDPTAAIAAARRGFTQETVPSILERAPGFSGSDLQRELTRGGVDLETNIAAMKEGSLGRVQQLVQALPQFAQAVGSNLTDQASQMLGLGQLGREFLQDVSPAGDALRTLMALQGIMGGPGLTTLGRSSGFSKSGNAGILS